MNPASENPGELDERRSAPSRATRRVSWKEVGEEPFRLFFPAGVLAGVVGVLLWPLHFAGAVEFYPGLVHARIMALGLFGAFILGFAGTALPRMLAAPPLGIQNVLLLCLLHLSMIAAFATGSALWGDRLAGLLLGLFALLMAARAWRRRDVPPPGFVLVGLAFLCACAGIALALVQHAEPELETRWVLLQRLFIYQGFILLPILGAGPFILPRLFGRPSSHDFPTTLNLPAAWKRKSALALATGLLIIGSFFMEAHGWGRAAYAIRFGTTLSFLLLEFPFRRAPGAAPSIAMSLRIAFGMVASGFLAVALLPAYRSGLLHVSLIGGFAIITFAVATWVVFGHSGHKTVLSGRNRWFLIAVGLMLFAMLTRISGDFWPKIMISHYTYGALLWVSGALLWAWHVLPKVLKTESVELGD
jgi:uncharacterized protein involved in response to NO